MDVPYKRPTPYECIDVVEPRDIEYPDTVNRMSDFISKHEFNCNSCNFCNADKPYMCGESSEDKAYTRDCNLY